MTKLQIRMRQVDQVKEFVDLLSKYPYEMDLVSGRYTIDAKSLLGIYSLDLSNPLTLVIYSDSCEELLTQLHALLPDCIVRFSTLFSFFHLHRSVLVLLHQNRTVF